MILKIDDDRYINTDQILTVTPDPDNSADSFMISFSGAVVIYVPGPVLNYILEAIDANTGYTNAPTPEDIPARPLASRVSSLLRDHLNGLNFPQLMALLSLKSEDETALELALKALVEDNVINARQGEDLVWRWFHNSTPGAPSQW